VNQEEATLRSIPETRFRELYELHASTVARYAARRVPIDDVHDVLSETFLTAWRKLDAVPEDAVPWLFATARRHIAIAQMLVDVPVHPSVDVDELKDSPEVRDRYQLGAEVTAAVSCAWISQWVDATNEGDEAAAQEAVDAMATARNWTILQDMNEEGDWPEAVWVYADEMVENSSVPAGRPLTVEESYRSALGCESGARSPTRSCRGTPGADR
jgi:DNA-directed RNA polymerase specialized sigma24 family protein